MSMGVYVHIPFCKAKCNYCDFFSLAPQKYDDSTLWQDEQATYVEFLCKETMLYKSIYKSRSIETLYLGGGTPTCLTGGQLHFLLGFFGREFKLSKDTEITIEANPGTLTKDKLSMMKEAGCNRLSLGVQSFDEDELKLLGRIHNSRDVYQTYYLARESGYDNISIDLMYGLPGQKIYDWKNNLHKAIELEPDHISLYQLNIEEDTPFYFMKKKGLIDECDQELALRMYEYAIDTLTEIGFTHYEISNFARFGKKSRHNQLYWQYKEYLGLGASASGFLKRNRYANLRDLDEYFRYVNMGKKPIMEEEVIDETLAQRETMFLGLRLIEGVNKEEFYTMFNIKIEDVFGDNINYLKKNKLIDENNSHIYLTKKGLYLANQVFMEFL